MLNSPSLNPHRIARASVLNGVPIPQHVCDQLTAQGVNVGELETRLRDSVSFKS
jgi:hypothetical protein